MLCHSRQKTLGIGVGVELDIRGMFNKTDNKQEVCAWPIDTTPRYRVAGYTQDSSGGCSGG